MASENEHRNTKYRLMLLFVPVDWSVFPGAYTGLAIYPCTLQRRIITAICSLRFVSFPLHNLCLACHDCFLLLPDPVMLWIKYKCVWALQVCDPHPPPPPPPPPRPPARNESQCYSFTSWVQPLSHKGCHAYRFLIFNEISFSSFFYIKQYPCNTHKKFTSVISKSLKQATLQQGI